MDARAERADHGRARRAHVACRMHASRVSHRHHPSREAEDRDVGLDDRRQEGASVYLRHGHRVRVALRPATSACVKRIESNRMRELNCIALHCVASRRRRDSKRTAG